MCSSSPSAACVITISGFTCADAGKSFGKRREDHLRRGAVDVDGRDRRRHRGVEVQHGKLLPRRERHGIALDAVARRDLPRRSARRGHRPDVAALDVVRVRAVVQRLPVRRERHGRGVLDQPVRRRELHRRRVRACDLDRVVAVPLVVGNDGLEDRALASPANGVDRGEHALVRLAVPELAERAGGQIVRVHRERVAALEGRRVESGRARSRSGVSAATTATTASSPATAATSAEPAATAGHTAAPERLRRGRAARVPDPAAALLRLQPERCSRPAQECDLLTIRRPRRASIAVHARSDVAHLARLHVVQTDERMVLAHAHERDLRAIGRPARLAVASPEFDERNAAGVHPRWRGLLRRPRAVDLVVLHVQDPFAVG